MALKTRNLVMAVLGLLAAGALGITAFHTPAVPVDLHTAARGTLSVTVNADGKTRIREIYDVATPITGTALRSPVRVGDEVTGGETVVAVLKPAVSGLLDARTRGQAEAAVREAEAGLALARSRMRQAAESLELAESEHRRAKTLVEHNVASATRLETAERRLQIERAAMTATVSGLEMAKGTLDRARAALIGPYDPEGGGRCCLELTAPQSGRVLSVDVLSEQVVLAGTKLLSVGDPADLEIVADLLSSDAVRLEPGDRAIVERWGGDGALEARVARIEPAAYTKVSALGIEEQRVDVVLDLVSPPKERTGLGGGFSVFLRIVEWEQDDVLMVPLSAVFRHGGGWAVFAAEDGVARLRPVETGRRNGTHAQVVSGLEEGELVILHPSGTIAGGVAVTPREG
ncbi:efflux RND transporter periplasmic adaptor subunit [Roseobacteraceae bacterium NS-SX3]